MYLLVAHLTLRLLQLFRLLVRCSRKFLIKRFGVPQGRKIPI